MAKKKIKSGIKVKFCGTNSMEVTGSCTHISVADKQLLLECGLYQSCGSILSNYRVNSRKFDFKAKEIDYVFVCHSHIDHCGLLPLLYKRGFNC
jgi:metallo-beta-lactamase family protein